MPTEETFETEFKCALSGHAATPDLLIEDAEDDDDMGETPIGWLRVTFERRGVNPEWVELQTRKARILAVSVAGTMAQLPADMPEEEKAEVAKDIAANVDANFAYRDTQVDKYISIEAVVYIKDPDTDPQIAAEWAVLAKNLGVVFVEAE